MFEPGEALLENRKGQSLLEYSLILSLVSIAAIVTLRLLGPQVVIFFTAAKDAF
jgi:Flp pilus assembly pilin Flp